MHLRVIVGGASALRRVSNVWGDALCVGVQVTVETLVRRDGACTLVLPAMTPQWRSLYAQDDNDSREDSLKN
jgi:hypothetical protein